MSTETVFNKWRAHLKNEIGEKQGATNAGMKFNKASSVPVKKLTNFYVVGDASKATECYIAAHGGSFDDDYALDTKSFKVPTGVKLNFYQPHGYALQGGAATLRHGAPVKHGGTNDQLYTGGMECPNYILSKAHGKQLGAGFDAATWEMDYAGVQKVAGDLNIVMVTVRNRWHHYGVTLKSAVADVRGAFKSITTFNCLFCRVDDTGKTHNWNSQSGAWS